MCDQWYNSRLCALGNHLSAKAQPRFNSWGSESGKARIESAKRPRFESEARIKGEAGEKAGGGGGLVSCSPEIFWNFELQILQFGVFFEREILKKSTFQRKHIEKHLYLQSNRVNPTHVRSSVQN